MGRRAVGKKEEAKEPKLPGGEKAKSLLNYPEVQKAFVDLAKSQAQVLLLEEKNRELWRSLQGAREEAQGTHKELEAKEAEVARLNSVVKQKDDEVKAAEQKQKAVETDHREKDRLVKERPVI